MSRDTEKEPNQSISNQNSQEPEHPDRWHVVQPGENLSSIAQTYYGPEHASQWITLYNFNRKLIGENPNLLQPGMGLRIPDLTEFL